MPDSAAEAVLLYEVGPRDGLQNEPDSVSTAHKLELVQRLALAGLRRVEVTSFVSPRWIPQLADASELAGLLPDLPGVVYGALVPNVRGYERLRDASAIHLAAVFLSASEAHNRANVNASVAESLERFRPVAEAARADGRGLRAYVSTVCGCPYEGEVAVSAVVRCVEALVELGADEISLGDTIGVGTPGQVRALVAAVADAAPLERIAFHGHDTYGRALANVEAAYEAGVRRFDGSVGGLGGCPYAPGAAGNAATEDLVDLFERSGISTGVALDALVDLAAWLEDDVLRRPLPGRVYRAVRGARERAARAAFAGRAGPAAPGSTRGPG